MRAASAILPPTTGLADPDPACPLRARARRRVRSTRVRAALSNSFGFGGMDSAVVMTEPESRARLAGDQEGRAHRRLRGDRARHGDRSRARRAPRGAGARGPDSRRRAARSTGQGAALRSLGEALRRGGARRRGRRRSAGSALDRARCGVVFGSAFGAVDESAAFVHRIFEKGPRLASPFEFPNLVPSSPIGHASIYLGLHGPSLATADLRSSGESAILSAIELVAMGEAEAFVAGGITVRSEMVDAAFYPLFDDHASTAPRSELAAAVVVESAEGARKRGARIFARIDGQWALPEGEVPALEAPSATAVVVAAVTRASVAARLASTAWASVPVWDVSGGTGDNEAAGAAAVGAAARLLARGEATEALVVGPRVGWTTFLLLRAP